MLKVKCPLCGNDYVNHDAVYSHIDRVHGDELPKGFSSDRYFYDLTHKGKVSRCVVCKQETAWNERTHKYHRLCGKQSCADKVRNDFRERMMRVHGTDNLAKDPEHQRKMLKNRSISGEYKWSSGAVTAYTGTYELDFLKACDTLLDLDAKDVIESPFTYRYKYDGKEHFYIPDFYIPDLELEIEIKDGGDNPNMHHKIQSVDKVKEKLKDKVMSQQKNHHYIKIVNKNYGPFIDLVNKLVADDLTRQERINKIKVY